MYLDRLDQKSARDADEFQPAPCPESLRRGRSSGCALIFSPNNLTGALTRSLPSFGRSSTIVWLWFKLSPHNLPGALRFRVDPIPLFFLAFSMAVSFPFYRAVRFLARAARTSTSG